MSDQNKKLKEEKKIIDTSDHTDDDIVEHLIIKKGVPIGVHGEVSVVEEYVETRRYNRQKYINSFRDDVGIVNMLKKVNAGLLNPGVLAASFSEDETKIFDISGVPTDVGDAMSLVDNARAVYSSLPPDLTKGMDFNTFCKTFDQKAFNAYLESKIPKEKPKEKPKETEANK